MTGGIYGKMPSAADFCRQRLPNTFVEPWDKWLQQSLAGARDKLGDAWARTYLSSPVWCFAIDPGVISEVGWTGVIATSVDSTGRYYPLTLAVSVEQLMPCQTLRPDSGALGKTDTLRNEQKRLREIKRVLGKVHGRSKGG